LRNYVQVPVQGGKMEKLLKSSSFMEIRMGVYSGGFEDAKL